MSKLSEEELDQMVRDAAVDCYNDDEVFMGILCTLQDEFSFGLGDLGIELDSVNSRWFQMLHYWNSKY